jgi:hypothetical protein
MMPVGISPPGCHLTTRRIMRARAVARQATIAVGQMRVGDEGYCIVGALYVAPVSPTGPDEGRGVAHTAQFLLPDSDVYSEPSPTAKVHVTRLEDGFAIRLPPGEVASRYLPRPVPGSLPVVGTESSRVPS